MSTTVEFKFDIGDELIWVNEVDRIRRFGTVWGCGYTSEGHVYNVACYRVLEREVTDYVEDRR